MIAVIPVFRCSQAVSDMYVCVCVSVRTRYGPGGGFNASKGVCPGRPAGMVDLPVGIIVEPGDLCANSASAPTSNFLGQILPLTRLTIKGALWYQGK